VDLESGPSTTLKRSGARNIAVAFEQNFRGDPPPSFTLPAIWVLQISGHGRPGSNGRCQPCSPVTCATARVIPPGLLQVALLRRTQRTQEPPEPPMSEASDDSARQRTYSRSELLRGALLTITGSRPACATRAGGTLDPLSQQALPPLACPRFMRSAVTSFPDVGEAQCAVIVAGERSRNEQRLGLVLQLQRLAA